MDYQLTISLSRDTIENLMRGNFELCFSYGLDQGGHSTYNVVAYTSPVSESITIKWTDAYEIAATTKDDLYYKVSAIQAFVYPQPIRFGETYCLNKHYMSDPRPPNPDEKAPKAGFLFKNEIGASAIIYKKIQGAMSPIYVSSNGPLAPGSSEKLVSLPKVMVWFATGTRSATYMDSSHITTLTKEIDFTGLSAAEVTFGSFGEWSVERTTARA